MQMLSSSDNDPIHRLPDDVLVDVMCMLPLCDLLRCRRVNRRFRALGRRERVDRHLMACLSSLDRLPDCCAKRIVTAGNLHLLKHFLQVQWAYPFQWDMLRLEAACLGNLETIEQRMSCKAAPVQTSVDISSIVEMFWSSRPERVRIVRYLFKGRACNWDRCIYSAADGGLDPVVRWLIETAKVVAPWAHSMYGQQWSEYADHAAATWALIKRSGGWTRLRSGR